MISDEDIEKAVDYLRDNAPDAAKARAERLYVEEFAKSLKAILMQELSPKFPTVAAQEREALASLKYLQQLEAVREAVEIDERHRFLRAAAEAKINAWQTFSANLRGIKL